MSEGEDKGLWIRTILDQMAVAETPGMKEAVEACGRACVRSAEGFDAISALRKKVGESASPEILFHAYKEEIYENRPNIWWKDGAVFLEYDRCACGMVTSGTVANPFLCHCTVGYSKEVFETLFGHPVAVELQGSILRGDSKCRQKITVVRER